MSERIKQHAKTFEDPTSYGQGFMPPWTVTCNKCGRNMVSYVNEATDICKSCGGEVHKADPAIDHMKRKQEILPAHSIISKDGIKAVNPVTTESRKISDILAEQSNLQTKQRTENVSTGAPAIPQKIKHKIPNVSIETEESIQSGFPEEISPLGEIE